MSVHLVEGSEPPAPEAVQKLYDDVGAFNEQLRNDGNWVFAGGLQGPETAAVVRSEGGQVATTDDPFA